MYQSHFLLWIQILYMDEGAGNTNGMTHMMRTEKKMIQLI